MEQSEQLFKVGKPLGSRVVIEADKAADKTKSGLFIPEMAKERPQFGTVLAVGPEVVCKDIQEGSRVIFGKHAGTPLIIENNTYFIMQEREVFMILDQEELDKILLGLADAPAAVDNLKIEILSEKANYKVGENIKVVFAGTNTGTAIIIVKAGKEHYRDISMRVVKGDNVFEFPAADMCVPEVTVTIESEEKGATSYDLPLKRSGELSLEVYN